MITALVSCIGVDRKPSSPEVVSFQMVSPPAGQPDAASLNQFSSGNGGAAVTLTIDNPAEQGKFVPGKNYYLQISPV